MKNLGLILVGGVTVPILLLVGLYILRPSGVPLQPRLVISIEEDIAEIEASLGQEKATVQASLDSLNNEFTRQQADFSAQTETWNDDIMRLQEQSNALDTSAQILQTEVATLEMSRTLRLTDYQNQLKEVQQQYQTELNVLQAELNQKQIQLDELNAKLADWEK